MQSPKSPVPEANRYRLLVADDDLEMRTLLRKVLVREGFEVVSVSNGKEALAAIDRSPNFDLLVSDIRMPEKDGEQLLEEARRLQPNLKVVLITSYGEMDQYSRLVKKGAFDFLTKPFKIPDLLDIIERAVSMAA